MTNREWILENLADKANRALAEVFCQLFPRCADGCPIGLDEDEGCNRFNERFIADWMQSQHESVTKCHGYEVTK